MDSHVLFCVVCAIGCGVALICEGLSVYLTLVTACGFIEQLFFLQSALVTQDLPHALIRMIDKPALIHMNLNMVGFTLMNLVWALSQRKHRFTGTLVMLGTVLCDAPLLGVFFVLGRLNFDLTNAQLVKETPNRTLLLFLGGLVQIFYHVLAYMLPGRSVWFPTDAEEMLLLVAGDSLHRHHFALLVGAAAVFAPFIMKGFARSFSGFVVRVLLLACYAVDPVFVYYVLWFHRPLIYTPVRITLGAPPRPPTPIPSERSAFTPTSDARSPKAFVFDRKEQADAPTGAAPGFAPVFVSARVRAYERRTRKVD
ncbi:Hypothetical protein POVN_LOCUS592 [uncultured virus]|nr:Hypothetical protein POVN_LOCUS592 [uncultured virus]